MNSSVDEAKAWIRKYFSDAWKYSYSLNDFHLFLQVKQHLGKIHFANVNELEQEDEYSDCQKSRLTLVLKKCYHDTKKILGFKKIMSKNNYYM